MEITRELVNKINTLLDAGLTSGLGTPRPGQMCVEAAINYALDRPHGDDPGCVLEGLRRLKIGLNDSPYWTSNIARANGLRRLAIAQLGTKGCIDPTEFAKKIARMTIQTVVPSALRSAAKRLTGEHATKLLLLAQKCQDEPTRENAVEATDAYAAADAAYAAHAAADAYAAADAADAAAYAAYAAHAAADAAADAAAYAAYAAADAAYAAEQELITFAENVVQILIELKAPGCQWL